jgi:hypothetical protein
MVKEDAAVETSDADDTLIAAVAAITAMLFMIQKS